MLAIVRRSMICDLEQGGRKSAPRVTLGDVVVRVGSLLKLIESAYIDQGAFF